ncbi:MAG: murein biosynthesis integral membrane protein MurJ [Deltaproteobacteria bacterium RIFOXYD12_FULL_57_12]|nr:MAG: murein biosynthesis integral membrane protein MurJ [Deltaproteobacteria bacterium RIFOXYD12_FULL_57_12]
MNKPSDDTGRIARSAGTVSIAVMCSRVLGLVREQVFAGMFGAGYAYDAFVVAFRIPNLLRDLFAEGALSAAFVTVFTDYDTNRGEQATWKLASNVMVFLAIVLSLVTLAGCLFADQILMLLAPDFALVTGKMELTRKLTVIMFPFLIFISLAAVAMGILNTRGRFFVPAMASSYFNLGSIVGGVALALLLPRFGQPAIVGMAFGTLIGGLLQLAMQLPTLARTGFTFRPHLDLTDPGLKRILFLMLPAVIGLSATQINIFVNTNFAASCAEGSVSWLNYAFRFVQFPIGVFGVAISIATLPVISRHAATRDMASLKTAYSSALTMAFCLTIPATVGLIILAEPIIRIIYQHGAFTAYDTLMTGQTLALYSLGLFAYASVKIMVPVFYALNDTKYPVIGSFLAVGANIIIILLTIDRFQHQAIALSTSCTMTINFLFLSFVLHRKLAGYPLGYLFTGLGKVLLAAAAMGGYLYLIESSLAAWAAQGFSRQVVALLFSIATGTALYGTLLHLLRLQELRFLTEKILSRLRGR